jgi:hypothetical protein
MSKAEEKAQATYPAWRNGIGDEFNSNSAYYGFIEGYHQAEKDVAEAFARIIRGNLSGIGNGIQNMFEQLYTDITGEKMYKGFKD